MNGASSGGSPTARTFAMPQPGDVVAGKYAIVRVLGEGGMGIVYEATHQRLRQRVAVKMLLPAMLEHEVLVSRFEREARAAAQLRGRHCVRVKDVDVTADGLPYMVMDFLDGHDLQVEIERRGRLPISEAVDYVLQACAAMVEAHQLGIVHRDLKPSNLFLEVENETHIVKVLDFGISKVAATEDDVKLTAADAIVGTAFYMSPEQVRGSHSVDARADIWGLGVILYEALAGRVPWLGAPTRVAAMIVTEDPPDLRALCTVPGDLAAIVHKTLQREPSNRFTDVKALAMALAPFAPAGSAGRSFADNVVASGSYPCVSITPKNASPVDSSPSLVPSLDSPDTAKTVLQAFVVAEEETRSHEAGTAPGWSKPPPAPALSRGRAALIGVLIAVVIGVLSIGAVVLFVRGRAPSSVVAADRAPPPPPPIATPAPTTTTTTSSGASAEPAPASTMKSEPAPAPAPSKPATVRTPPGLTKAPAPAPKPTVKPTASAPANAPLFL